MDFTTLPQQITGLKAHPENKPTVLKALSNWCEAQDALLQDLKALESRASPLLTELHQLIAVRPRSTGSGRFLAGDPPNF